eukprot:NODE_2503_length_2201_cov_5.883317.p1 GENE.NODE_2503_length_2201_cov_5.883317~~NODE_2503_length_2201_cov_5.883317.p1  ORF type:complete len:502 (-),score=177.50 NODE_2503_length_2201_cov_5.883317:603-2108(-)
MGHHHSRSHNELLAPQEFQRLFKILDADNTGTLTGAEIDEMFTAILGFDCGDHKGASEFDIQGFKNVCNQSHANHPGWNVKKNLKKYIAENQHKVAPEQNLDDAALSPANLAKLFALLDTDGSGMLDAMEAYKLFKAAGLPVSIMLEKLETTTTLNPVQFAEVIAAVDHAHPEKNVDGKVLEFLQVAMHKGKPAMDSINLERPDEHVAPPSEDAVGRKKALIIGINYLGSANQLGGCINDAKAEFKMLTDHFGFAAENILLLTEDQGDASKSPTKATILGAMDWLLDGATRGDVLFFHYSGHGSQVDDPTGEEEDGKNECLCPVDCMANPWPGAVIIDDYLNEIFLDRLPEGVRLTCVYDCCHSGTMTDLSVHRALEFGPPSDIQDRFMHPPPEVLDRLRAQKEVNQPKLKTRDLSQPKLLWTISGCQDSQTSADATIGGVRRGALTWSLHDALEASNYNISYEDLLTSSRKKLKGKYTQTPAMSTTAEQNFRCKFLGCGL